MLLFLTSHFKGSFFSFHWNSSALKANNQASRIGKHLAVLHPKADGVIFSRFERVGGAGGEAEIKKNTFPLFLQ